MTNVNDRRITAGRAVAAALAGSAAASAAVPEADLEPLTGGTALDPARTGATRPAGAGSAAAVPAGDPLDAPTQAEAMLAWRWVVGTDALDLHAVHPSSPHWRATCVGAGGALHRARVALAAEGLAARVTLLPDTPARWETGSLDSPRLARVVVAGIVEVTDEARALFAATDPEDGVDDRDPGGLALRGRGPARAVIRELVGAARAEGVRLRLVRDGGELVGLLHGPDTREAWLRAGMATSAVRLLARRHGLATATAVAADHPGVTTRRRASLPATRPVRAGWRRIGEREGWLSVGIGTPYMRLRLGPFSAD